MKEIRRQEMIMGINKRERCEGERRRKVRKKRRVTSDERES